MSKIFQDWVKSKDEFVKEQVAQAANQQDLTCTFKGYYIEDNDYTGSGEAVPLFKSFEHYDGDTRTTMFANHVRYFFELNNSDKKHTATVHFSEADETIMLFSIEETYAEVVLENDDVASDNFEDLKKLMAKKFNLNKQ